MFPNNHLTHYGFAVLDTRATDDNVTDIDVLDYDNAALLGNASSPAKAQDFVVEEEPSPDIKAGDGHSIGGAGKCMGEDLKMCLFTDSIFTRAADGTTIIVAPDHVRQGQLNNCPLPAALAAMAHVGWSRDLLSTMIKTRQVRTVSHRAPKPWEACPSGAPPAKPATYIGKQIVTVTFRRKLVPSASAGIPPSFLTKLIKGSSVSITRALYYEKIIGDEIYYASSSDGSLWPSLIEKAYAVARGNNSYEGIERFLYAHLVKAFDDGLLTSLPVGIDPLDVLKDVADVNSKAVSIKSLNNKELRRILKKHHVRPTIADTFDDFEADAFYTPDHTYAIIDFNKKTELITIYNAAGGLTNTATLSAFRKHFNNLFFTKREA